MNAPQDMLNRLIILTVVTLSRFTATAQDSSGASLPQVPVKYIDKLADKAGKMEQALDSKSEKALHHLKRLEEKMRKKLVKIDSSAAKEIFTTAEAKYKRLEQKLQHPGELEQYLPRLDTMFTSLKFIKENPQLLSGLKEIRDKLDKALSQVEGLKSKLQSAEEIKQFLKERRQFLKEQLSRFGFAKDLKRINKEVYYYGQQLTEFKEMLKDEKKIEQKTIELLFKTKLFRDFMSRNSLLSSLMGMPGMNTGNTANQAGFAGIQTRAQVTNYIQQAGMAGPNILGSLQQSIENAQGQVNQLRNKINQLTGGGGDLDMPDFKPNSQKTKSFFKRIEYGTSVQTQKATSFFPVTSDIGLSMGYKLNDKSILGIGASYKMGWGNSWNNIKVTTQGLGLRSFIDWKIKKTFWLTGGYEQNYRSELRGLVLPGSKQIGLWQESGLVGITKSVPLKSKFLKKTKLQLLWDFLSYRQLPRTQPVLLRVGYSF